MYVTVEMLSKATWCFRSESGLEFFTSCQAAIESLLARGVTRQQIVMDYRVADKKAKSKALAERYAATYGVDGRRFMPNGKLDRVEYPATDGTEQRQLRKRVVVCPHCGEAVRKWNVSYR